MTATTSATGVNYAVQNEAERRLRVRKDIATFEAAIAHYPERAKAPASFVYQFMMQRANESPALVASILKKIDPQGYPNKENYIYQVTTGRYFRQASGTAAIDALVEIADRLRGYDLTSEQTGKVPFNEKLSAWRAVRDYIDRKRARDAVCKFGAIEGDTGTGKTCATKHYQMLNNHLTTVRFEAPSHPSLSRFTAKLGACYNVSMSHHGSRRMLDIEENVNDTRCIIVENVQRLYNPRLGEKQETFSYLQELQDDTGCTIMMTWTPVFRRDLNGKDAPFFRQFISRIGGMEDVLVLDGKLPKRDVLSIAEQFEIEDIDGCLPLLRSWAALPGPLRIIYDRLQKAKILARGKAPTLNHLEAVATEPITASSEEDES